MEPSTALDGVLDFLHDSRLWTVEEDNILLRHAQKRGTKHWGELHASGTLPRRDNKACCNRFIFLKKRFLEERSSLLATGQRQDAQVVVDSRQGPIPMGSLTFAELDVLFLPWHRLFEAEEGPTKRARQTDAPEVPLSRTRSPPDFPSGVGEMPCTSARQGAPCRSACPFPVSICSPARAVPPASIAGGRPEGTFMPPRGDRQQFGSTELESCTNQGAAEHIRAGEEGCDEDDLDGVHNMPDQLLAGTMLEQLLCAKFTAGSSGRKGLQAQQSATCATATAGPLPTRNMFVGEQPMARQAPSGAASQERASRETTHELWSGVIKDLLQSGDKWQGMDEHATGMAHAVRPQGCQVQGCSGGGGAQGQAQEANTVLQNERLAEAAPWNQAALHSQPEAAGRQPGKALQCITGSFGQVGSLDGLCGSDHRTCALERDEVRNLAEQQGFSLPQHERVKFSQGDSRAGQDGVQGGEGNPTIWRGALALGQDGPRSSLNLGGKTVQLEQDVGRVSLERLNSALDSVMDGQHRQDRLLYGQGSLMLRPCESVLQRGTDSDALVPGSLLDAAPRGRSLRNLSLLELKAMLSDWTPERQHMQDVMQELQEQARLQRLGNFITVSNAAIEGPTPGTVQRATLDGPAAPQALLPSKEHPFAVTNAGVLGAQMAPTHIAPGLPTASRITIFPGWGEAASPGPAGLSWPGERTGLKATNHFNAGRPTGAKAILSASSGDPARPQGGVGHGETNQFSPVAQETLGVTRSTVPGGPGGPGGTAFPSHKPQVAADSGACGSRSFQGTVLGEPSALPPATIAAQGPRLATSHAAQRSGRFTRAPAEILRPFLYPMPQSAAEQQCRVPPTQPPDNPFVVADPHQVQEHPDMFLKLQPSSCGHAVARGTEWVSGMGAPAARRVLAGIKHPATTSWSSALSAATVPALSTDRALPWQPSDVMRKAVSLSDELDFQLSSKGQPPMAGLGHAASLLQPAGSSASLNGSRAQGGHLGYSLSSWAPNNV